MATIDLIVLGMLKKEVLSAYDIQKQVEYKNISRWVKISTPSIYKKVIQLEGKGYIKSTPVKEGNMPEKAVYSLTSAGEQEFERLMLEIAEKPVRIFLDFNAVIVNLELLSKEKKKKCLDDIEKEVGVMKSYIEENIALKEQIPEIPETGKAVLRQQLLLAEALEAWIASLKATLL
ncbi:MAG: PadR family transcriptional regulator [Faecalicatena sp.]|uniref:PadR family transcriptional regulator n=1 Tax=Faecalicatena sp. TaxID=2005360 RepID=UPI0025856850|nr:PadR family transcriptional regulator [Faecalicatena sp.]MCI6467238.1 PadR family transcriptional regulator [Faecalicatena sp.]MDY5620243.1 PadR family transcriptional regulator [Lachnospiraceae bacterium]